MREPLVHFLLSGGLIFGAFTFLGADIDPTDRSIEVTQKRQAELALRFERTLGRPPSEAELDGLIDRWIREEVLYREALRLGLDREDPIVRRRLATKMDEIAGARAELARPREEELRRWLGEHADRFGGTTRLTFEQRHFETEAKARAALMSGNPQGSKIDLPSRLSETSRADIRAQFGRQFDRELARLEARPTWQGPITSGFGWHIVRLEARARAAPPAFEEVRTQVENDWRNATIAARREAAFRALEEGYSIAIER